MRDMVETQKNTMSAMGNQLKEFRRLFVREGEEVLRSPRRLDAVETRLAKMEDTVNQTSQRVEEVLGLIKNMTSA